MRIKSDNLRIEQVLENSEGWLKFHGAPLAPSFQSMVLAALIDRVIFVRTPDFDTWIKRMVLEKVLRPDPFIDSIHRFNAEGQRVNRVTGESNYRETRIYCSAQIVLHSTGVVEMDFDWFNPNEGLAGALPHLIEFSWYRIPILFGHHISKTNPFRVCRELQKIGIPVVDVRLAARAA